MINERALIIACGIFFLTQAVNAQQGVNWLRCIGGSGPELFSKSVITRQGNIISIGNSESNDGDASGNHGTVDVIVSAFSTNGTLIWNKMIGGSDWDGVNAADIDTLTDGNIVVGFSSASNNGDIIGNHGLTDFVFRKYTINGTLVWSKTYGGNKEENLDQIKATPDGGLIAIGSTNSNNNGNVGPGNSTTTYDLWVVKLDASGNIQWQKCLGGTQNEADGSVFSSPDGGYYFSSGTSSSDGNLAGLVPNGTVTGDYDVWFGKLSANGDIVWAKQIGGSGTDDLPYIQEKNSNIYLAFKTNSSDRDIPINIGHFDAALFKFNASGSLIWKQVYGGFSFDNSAGIAFHPNGSLYLLVNVWSTSLSGFPVYNPGDNQMVCARIDTLTGTLSNIRSFGGSLRDFPGDIEISNAGDIYITGTTFSTNYGITGNHGNSDGLVFRISTANLIQGVVFMDRNSNNVFDPGSDQQMSYIPVETNRQGIVQGVSVSNNGSYSIEVDNGTFSTKPKIYHSSYYTAIPDSFQCTLNNTTQFFYKDIQLRATPGIRDLAVYTAPVNPARPAFRTTYILVGQNLGTDTVNSGTISWKKDPRVTVTNFSIPPSGTFGDSIVWNFSNMRPLDSLRIYISVSTPPPPALNAGDTLKYVARIFPTASDAYITDNTLFLYNIVTGPFDPNEKVNLHGNKMTQAEIQAGPYINYIIHFQNVGTAPAFDVVVHDTLSNKLQLATLQSVTSSHPFSAEITGNVVKWKFININLPDSNSNEPGSKGFIAFRIKPSGGLFAGDSIMNKAGIYFDYNPAVITAPNVLKIVSNPIITGLPRNPEEDKYLRIFPNPLHSDILYIENKNTSQRYQHWRLFNQQGSVVQEGILTGMFTNLQLAIPKQLQNGFYYLEFYGGNNSVYKQFILLR